MGGMFASPEDLTAKARIRNAALELHAAKGESRTTLREVAQAAGVTPGLVVHHFGSKEGLRAAVEQLVIDQLLEALTAAPSLGPAAEVGAARDASVAQLVSANPLLVAYLRRSVLDSNSKESRLLERLTDFTLGQVRALRATGVARSTSAEEAQAASILMRALGPLLLEPVAAKVWEHATDGRPDAAPAPAVEVTLRP